MRGATSRKKRGGGNKAKAKGAELGQEQSQEQGQEQGLEQCALLPLAPQVRRAGRVLQPQIFPPQITEILVTEQRG